MELDDDERPLGTPLMRPRGKTAAPPPPAAPPDRRPDTTPADMGRHPADELGVPRQLPSQMHAPTEEELAAIRAASEQQAKKIYDQVAEQANLARFSRWRRHADRTLVFCGLAGFALLGLFVFSQSLQILAGLAVQPFALRVVGYAGLGTLLGVLAFFAIRLAILYFRLRANEQVSSIQLKELSRRAELRALVQRDKAAAKNSLESYLRAYPLDGTHGIEAVGLLRLDEAAVKELRDAREFLLDRDRFAGYDAWLKTFQDRFQSALQKKADRIMADWMKLVAIKTAISRSPLLDRIFVLYCSYGMLGDLCRLYNVRPSGIGTVRLVAYTMFNTYFAGQVEEHLDSLADVAGDAAAKLVEEFDLQPLFDGLNHWTFGASKLLGKNVVAPAADGAANALLLRKLGRATVALLRPIDPQ